MRGEAITSPHFKFALCPHQVIDLFAAPVLFQLSSLLPVVTWMVVP
jgi:hypothetical protein